jgi:hypothetical protein
MIGVGGGHVMDYETGWRAGNMASVAALKLYAERWKADEGPFELVRAALKELETILLKLEPNADA